MDEWEREAETTSVWDSIGTGQVSSPLDRVYAGHIKTVGNSLKLYTNFTDIGLLITVCFNHPSFVHSWPPCPKHSWSLYFTLIFILTWRFVHSPTPCPIHFTLILGRMSTSLKFDHQILNKSYVTVQIYRNEYNSRTLM